MTTTEDTRRPGPSWKHSSFCSYFNDDDPRACTCQPDRPAATEQAHRFYSGLLDLAERRLDNLFAQAAGRLGLIARGEGWRLRGRAYDPQPRGFVRSPRIGLTGFRCGACAAVTYGWALACGKCGVSR